MWLSSMDKSALVGAAGFSTILQGTLAGVSHTCVSGNRHIDLSSSSKSWSGQWTGSSSSWPLSENLWKILTWNHPWMRSLAEVQDSSREVSVHCWRKKKKKRLRLNILESVRGKRDITYDSCPPRRCNSVPRKSFSALDFFCGQKWEHMGECPVSLLCEMQRGPFLPHPMQSPELWATH